VDVDGALKAPPVGTMWCRSNGIKEGTLHVAAPTLVVGDEEAGREGKMELEELANCPPKRRNAACAAASAGVCGASPVEGVSED